MKLHTVNEHEFKKYGRVIHDLDVADLIDEMKKTPLPQDVIYIPSVPELEKLPVYDTLKTVIYGELPMQIGYCNGHNHLLNAVEYHRSSEVNVAVTDLILLLGMQQDINDDFTYDTSLIKAFLVPAKTAVEVYSTTLHYAPCEANDGGFQCVVVLPRDTNLDLECSHKKTDEDKLLTAKNKWLIAHKEAGLDNKAFVGLIGENISVRK